MGDLDSYICHGKCRLVQVRDPAARILVDEEEPGTSSTRPRWFVANIQLLAIGFLLVLAIVFFAESLGSDE